MTTDTGYIAHVETLAATAPDYPTDAEPEIGVGLCVDAAGLPIITADQMDCTECRGEGEIGVRQDHWGNWETKTCWRCQGYGVEP